MKASLTVILVAAFGGIFSNLIDIVRRLQMGSPDFPAPTYFIGCLIWAILGAFVALFWGEKNLKKVFYLGLGLPSLLQLNIGNISTPPADQQASVKSHIGIMVPSAYAQPPVIDIEGRTIRFTKTGRSPNADGYRAVFIGSNNRPKMVISINFQNQGIEVPEDAAYLAVEFRGSRSEKRISLSNQPNTLTKIEVDVRKRGWSGFLRSIGLRSAARYAVHVRTI